MKRSGTFLVQPARMFPRQHKGVSDLVSTSLVLSSPATALPCDLNLLPSTAHGFLPPKAQLAMYLQPSDATLRPDNAKFRRNNADKTLASKFSGKIKSALDYMRNRGIMRALRLWGVECLEINKVIQ